MTDRFYRWFERPCMILGTGCFFLYAVLVLLQVQPLDRAASDPATSSPALLLAVDRASHSSEGGASRAQKEVRE